jgi:queuosine precursor transporter
VFFLLRRLTGHRLLWLRATGSTVLSQAIDTVVVNGVLMAGTKSIGFILTVARNSYVMKLALAIGLTPLIYLGHAVMRRHFHITEVTRKEL